VEQAFELSDASAERSANGCTVHLDKEPIIEYLNSNITLLKWMIANGYEDRRTLERRIAAMEKWLQDPQLMKADDDAEYAEVIEIDLNTITEPLLACPNDPDDIKPLSEVAGTHVDEVFIGSCMTNIGHYRAAGKVLEKVSSLPTRLWVVPPTRMDEHELMEEGIYNIFGRAGARTEIPGCSLCMGNQARVRDNATVVSTSTRNFPNRLGNGADVYLASAELSAVAAALGHIPSIEEYMQGVKEIEPMSADIYRYLNFDQLDEYQSVADQVKVSIA
ncbi:MAG TPA: aconitate hydratase B, partial [Gammaproteobacteria bacterium]|nr:aconitate hydratase B [Gammaproteobacteria bacterium]